MRNGQLDNWRTYLYENPFRRLVCQRLPQLMQRAQCLIINGASYGAFGNFMLLRHPEKHQVFFHRKTEGTPTEQTHFWQKEHDRLTELALNGDVLVTPGISECEKRMKNESIAMQYRLIHIQDKPIQQRWKPEKSRFEACMAGTL